MKTYIHRELESKGLEAYHCTGCNSLFVDIENLEQVMCPRCYRFQKSVRV